MARLIFLCRYLNKAYPSEAAKHLHHCLGGAQGCPGVCAHTPFIALRLQMLWHVRLNQAASCIFGQTNEDPLSAAHPKHIDTKLGSKASQSGTLNSYVCPLKQICFHFIVKQSDDIIYVTGLSWGSVRQKWEASGSCLPSLPPRTKAMQLGVTEPGLWPQKGLCLPKISYCAKLELKTVTS